VLTVDLRRAATLHPVEDIDAPDVAPGDVEVRILDGVLYGYAYACPGCGVRDWLAIDGENPQIGWTVTAGDAARPETVSLSPSILHSAPRGGCGWHGYLTAGRFQPC
jgi:hypothetical protein